MLRIASLILLLPVAVSAHHVIDIDPKHANYWAGIHGMDWMTCVEEELQAGNHDPNSIADICESRIQIPTP